MPPLDLAATQRRGHVRLPSQAEAGYAHNSVRVADLRLVHVAGLRLVEDEAMKGRYQMWFLAFGLAALFACEEEIPDGPPTCSPSCAGGDSGTGSPLPPVTDYAQKGPFATTTQANVGPNNNYTVYRPTQLGTNGFIHSPVIFGPGILTAAWMYDAFLTHLASHGFVVICVNSMGGGPNAPGNLNDMRQGLEWLVAQNSQPGVFQGKLATKRAVAMGYSIGATASVQLSSHPAVMTTVAIHGHDTSGDPHGPVLLLTGTSDVITSVRRTLGTLDEAPAVMTALPINHLGVLTELAMLGTISRSSRYVAPITAWLRYWAHGDENAKRFFGGPTCEMCSSPWITPEGNAKWRALAL